MNAAQVFPVAFANVGVGPAGNIAVQVSHGIVQPDFPSSGPEIVVAYKGIMEALHPALPVTIPGIRFATADDLPPAGHAADLRAACNL